MRKIVVFFVVGAFPILNGFSGKTGNATNHFDLKSNAPVHKLDINCEIDGLSLEGKQTIINTIKFTIEVIDPVATATPNLDTLCNNESTNITIISNIPNTTFEIEVIRSGNIQGTSTLLDNGNKIIQTLTNPTDIYDYVDYRIIPTGPSPTYNIGTPDTVRVYVNPTPRGIIAVLSDTICNNTKAMLTLNSPSIFTSGAITIDYTSVTTGGVTGNSSAINRPNGYVFQDSLHNPTTLPATPETVTYTVTPRIPALGCANGPVATAVVKVHPTADTYFDFSNYNTEDSVTCYLDSDAFATVVAENGINQFTYLWDDPLSQTTFKASGLSMGEYIVTITDNQGCITWDTIAIKQPDRLTPVIDSIKYVTCFGYSDGYIRLAPTGGNGGYKYQWETGETTSFAKNLSGNIYDVVITDYKGCWQDTSIYIYEPFGINIDFSFDNVTCNGLNNGWIEAEATGAKTFYWIETGDTTQTIINLAPRIYNVEITDAGGCKSIDNQVITEPDSLIATTIPTNISCAGDADGTIDLSVQGGNGGYTYLWSNGSTNQDLQGLNAGTYSVIISDSKSCEARDTAIIMEPLELIVDLLNDTLICSGYEVDLSFSVTGGTPPYSYLWNQGLNSEQNQIVQPTQSTEYILKVNDSRSCEGIDSVLISVTQISTPEICMVLVDSSLAQPKNSIVWEKGDNPNIDYYKIYRETDNSDVYESIGDVSYSLPGKYVDPESNPEQESKRYKITTVDTCGNESDLSEYHQTIHIKVTQEGEFNKVSITNHYNGFDFSVYHIYRHDETSGLNLVHQMGNTINEWVDKTAPSAKYKYFVAAVKDDSPCIFDSNIVNGQLSQSISNIEQGEVVNSIINPGNNLLEINLYPNPAKRELVIETNNSGKIAAEIINLLGQKVFSFIVEKKTTIDISTLPNGIYFIKMSSENALFTKIFVKHQ